MSAQRHIYEGEFYDWVESGAQRSAQGLLPALERYFPVRSVLDVGCGTGTWLREWMRRGCDDVVGVDGDYVDRRRLLIPPARFMPHDLTKPLDLGRRFDLVQSLEVAEHIPARFADGFVRSLVRHGDMVMFSAAVPGQGGEFHVNEQPYEYWRDRFTAAGFRMYDCLRPQVLRDARIEPWYRYNVFLFVRSGHAASLPPEVALTQAPLSGPVRNVAPLHWRIRNHALSMLPEPVVTRLSRARYSLSNWIARR